MTNHLDSAYGSNTEEAGGSGEPQDHLSAELRQRAGAYLLAGGLLLAAVLVLLAGLCCGLF